MGLVHYYCTFLSAPQTLVFYPSTFIFLERNHFAFLCTALHVAALINWKHSCILLLLNFLWVFTLIFAMFFVKMLCDRQKSDWLVQSTSNSAETTSCYPTHSQNTSFFSAPTFTQLLVCPPQYISTLCPTRVLPPKLDELATIIQSYHVPSRIPFPFTRSFSASKPVTVSNSFTVHPILFITSKRLHALDNVVLYRRARLGVLDLTDAATLSSIADVGSIRIRSRQSCILLARFLAQPLHPVLQC